MNTSYRIELDVYGTETEIVSSVKINFYASEEGRKNEAVMTCRYMAKCCRQRCLPGISITFLCFRRREEKPNKKYHFC